MALSVAGCGDEKACRMSSKASDSACASAQLGNVCSPQTGHAVPLRVTSHLRQYSIRAMCPMVDRRNGRVWAEQLTAGKQ